MKLAYRVDQVRAMEEAALAADPVPELMQSAAAALAAAVSDLLRRRRGSVYGARVLIMVGRGNNGGDALYAGARLADRGAAVTALALLGEPHPAGLAALLAAGGRLVDAAPEELAALDVALDGVLGIGGRPGLPDDVAQLAAALDGAGVPLVAVDLPSGVDADTGAVPASAVRADLTVTFGVAKACQVIEPARSRCGELRVVDLGFDPALATDALRCLEPSDLATGWPFPGRSSDKYARGVVGIDTGSPDYPGAALLGTYGAVHAGAGMVRFLGPDEAGDRLLSLLPNVVRADGRVQARLVGSGWGDRPDGAEVLARVADEGLPAVVDADGLRFLPERCPSHWLLTPHAGELARLLDRPRAEVEADPLAAAHEGADRTGATVLLKGATQVVVEPGNASATIAVPGPAWTAQAGSGDVLAGVCAALLAAGLSTSDAGAYGASLQALAAAEFPGPVPPQQLATRFPTVLGRLEAARR
ncbi:hydroxyethylthiazole kinase-like uncharacterized protein yjeF [Friedmanniella endophytica]|uniref:Bifunctional NAD(P)H-hydrate repair enzyme n=1 Tax=Microlunatus kandeliicorticis TaxID=1759536 RepID=A0A7W3IQ51_9ACTN|nr:NAD(P)H-hydrate epimerase [Microlunatus kandeliicorticis]MBA8793181.1 hydroxyethylthiazole kinase-like uncharacterized protein yjeF [Microlunatus kandeliicorticis]